MNSPFSLPHKTHRAAKWLLGATAFVLWATVGSAAASAGVNGFCEQDREETTSAEDVVRATMKMNKSRAHSMTAMSSATIPCAQTNRSSASYNVCYTTNSRAISTMPQWLAELQAEEAVSAVFDQINHIHVEISSTESHTQEPLQTPNPNPWLDEIITELSRAALAGDHGPICIDGHFDESCENPPAMPGALSSGPLTPIYRTPSTLEAPWRPDDEGQTQQALVDLRVGPSTEHRRLPDRPPPHRRG